MLVAALATLNDLAWRLTIAGDRTRDPKAAAQLDADIDRHDLGARVDVLGARVAADASRRSMRQPTCSCCRRASRATAWPMPRRSRTACPSIGTTGGAIPDTVPAGAGILVPPDDVPALAAALRRLIGDSRPRSRLRHGARAAAPQACRPGGESAEICCARDRERA